MSALRRAGARRGDRAPYRAPCDRPSLVDARRRFPDPGDDKRRPYWRCSVGVVLLFAVATCLGASAIDGFDFADRETADRYQRLIAEFRCPKCLNESIASSGAPIAVDLRRTVRRLMDEGAADDAIRDHLQERYGDFVLYDPPFKPSTWFLWFSPVVLLGVGVFVLMRVARRGAAGETSSDDLDRARRLLRDTT